jgi:hypothetical protein
MPCPKIIIKLIQPENVDDQLTEILRNGALALLTQAVEAEVADFLGKHADLKTADGHQRVVRWRRLGLFPWHRRLGSHVPYKSLVELRAIYMPDVARSVSGHPPN